MTTSNNTENSIYLDKEAIYDKKIVSKPIPKRDIGIDTDNTIIQNIEYATSSNSMNISQIERFTQVTQSRDTVYSLIDDMCDDSMISAVLETYVEDSTERNDNGKIVWAESSNTEVAEYINYLLDSINVNKNIFKWTSCLCKYGDIYLRLYRQSDYDKGDPYKNNDNKEGLQESVKINAYKDADHFTHYVEMIPNPAQVFELTKFGKSYAYIVTPTNPTQIHKSSNQMNYYYAFNKNDVEIYGPTEFVHGCLDDNTSRIPEYVSIINSDSESEDTRDAYTYTVRRGQSLFYNVFKVWRQLSLLQNSILLNRVTKSSIIRVISVEVGDMDKNDVPKHLQSIKQLFEQKSAINAGVSMQEYTNPGPVDNNVYIATHDGKGTLNVGQVGGDVNVGQLTDVEYFRDLLFGGLRIPKQYFGFTEDGAGFNGGQSLSIISSRYAKAVKRIQSVMCQVLTDMINVFLLDKGLNTYVNKFTLKMVVPTTQEEIDRRDNIANKVRLVSDIMGNLNDIEDPVIKLKILKSMLSDALINEDVASLIQQEIDNLESENSKETEPTENVTREGEMSTSSETPSAVITSSTEDNAISDIGSSEEETDLPTPEDLGIDFTDSDNPEFQ